MQAAMNVTVHAAETGRKADRRISLLLRAAGDVSADWALWQSRPRPMCRLDIPGVLRAVLPYGVKGSQLSPLGR